jgi:hypothetical protein
VCEGTGKTTVQIWADQDIELEVEEQVECPLLKAGAEAHEKFVRESREIDLAWKAGKLDEWLEKKYDELGITRGNDPVESGGVESVSGGAG